MVGARCASWLGWDVAGVRLGLQCGWDVMCMYGGVTHGTLDDHHAVSKAQGGLCCKPSFSATAGVLSALDPVFM